MTARPGRGEAPRGPTAIASLTNGSPWTRPLPSKVPRVSLSFWILTILCTMFGATAADAVSSNLGVGLGLGIAATTAIVGQVVAVSLIWQLSTARYVPVAHWSTVFLIIVLANLVADDVAAGAGTGLWGIAGIFCAGLAVAITGWLLAGRAVSVDGVTTRRREAWYWLVVLCGFCLGSSIEGLLARGLGGVVPAGLLLACSLGVIVALRLGRDLDAAVALWAAYVVTWPLGAAIGDFLRVPSHDAGAGLAANVGAAGLLAAILLLGLLLGGRERWLRPTTRDDAP